jgi:hypothetical protein
MSDDPRHTSHRRRPIQVEPPKSCALLSAVRASTPPPSESETQLLVHTSNESVTFPAGASTETVAVPIISSVAMPGPMPIDLSAASTSPSVAVASAEEVVGLSSPDATPPTITGVQLVTQGKVASAVVHGFSKPTAPATVAKIHDCRILSVTSKSRLSYGLGNRSGAGINKKEGQ